MDIGGLFKSACGAVAKVAKAVVNTVSSAVKSVIEKASELFKSAIATLETAVSKAKDMAEELDFDGDGDIDIDDDFAEIVEEEFKLLVGAMLKEDWMNDPDGSMVGFAKSVEAWITNPEEMKRNFDSQIAELKRNDTAGNIIKNTDTFKWFRKKTQEGAFPNFFDIGGFDRDENGVYHAQQDALQKYGGYTDLYDDVFDLACSMDKKKFDFKVGNEEYIVWLWKGDYMNLGAGAETGIYKGGEPFWDCDTEDAMPMTLRLEDTSGNVIYDWKPNENKWWCTGFNPEYEDYNYKDLISIGTIDFSQNLDMWNAFKNRWKSSGVWKFHDENYIAEYIWKGKLK